MQLLHQYTSTYTSQARPSMLSASVKYNCIVSVMCHVHCNIIQVLLDYSGLYMVNICMTGQAQCRTHMHKSICSWLNHCWVKGRGTHFSHEYCWSTCKDENSQVKWVPHPFFWQLFNCKQIDSCVRVRCCTWAVPYIPQLWFRSKGRSYSDDWHKIYL